MKRLNDHVQRPGGGNRRHRLLGLERRSGDQVYTSKEDELDEVVPWMLTRSRRKKTLERAKASLRVRGCLLSPALEFEGVCFHKGIKGHKAVDCWRKKPEVTEAKTARKARRRQERRHVQRKKSKRKPLESRSKGPPSPPPLPPPLPPAPRSPSPSTRGKGIGAWDPEGDSWQEGEIWTSGSTSQIDNTLSGDGSWLERTVERCCERQTWVRTSNLSKHGHTVFSCTEKTDERKDVGAMGLEVKTHRRDWIRPNCPTGAAVIALPKSFVSGAGGNASHYMS